MSVNIDNKGPKFDISTRLLKGMPLFEVYKKILKTCVPSADQEIL
jgi:hypothetical protein